MACMNASALTTLAMPPDSPQALDGYVAAQRTVQPMLRAIEAGGRGRGHWGRLGMALIQLLVVRRRVVVGVAGGVSRACG